MARTDHHKKPGTPVRPRKKPLPHGRADAQLRNDMFGAIFGRDTSHLAITEPTHVRRTR